VRYWLKRHPDDHVVALDRLTYAGDPRNLDGSGSASRSATFASSTRRPTSWLRSASTRSSTSRPSRTTAVPFSIRAASSARMSSVRGRCSKRRAGVASSGHHIWACEVCGELPLDSGDAFTEDSTCRPGTPYSASQAAADLAVRAYSETSGLPVTITNCSNNYGPRQYPEKVVLLFLTDALDDRELPLYASTQSRREWLHVDDYCRAVEVVLERGREGETYNIGSGVERSIEEIPDLVLGLAGKPESLKTIVPDRPGRDCRYLLDSSKIRAELGWQPEVSFEDVLRATVEWYAANRAWWEPLKERAAVRETAWS
jgi:dTDP-glucose 4,6-dehydratase